MVIKGRARADASGLATHLQRTDTNERVTVLELRGTVADDLDGALLEMEAIGAGARTRRPLYHASINTAPDEHLTPSQRAAAVDRLEAELGLIGQARAVVEHEKEGRAHVHVVWSRIDLERMTAISDSHNYRKHELVARQLEHEFGHERVQGAHVEREGAERPARTPSHAEMQQAERTGLSPQEAKAQLTALWNRTDSGKAFAAALDQEGWILARGDKRDFVALDPAGETHSLARRIEGTKAKDVRERLADIDRDSLPSVEEARARQAERERVAPTLENSPSPATPAQAVERGTPTYPAPRDNASAATATRPIVAPSPETTPRPTAAVESQFVAAARATTGPKPAPQPAQQRARAPAPTQGAPAATREKAADKAVSMFTSALGALARPLEKILDVLGDLIAPTAPPTPDQAERMERAADERREEATAAAAQRQEAEAKDWQLLEEHRRQQRRAQDIYSRFGGVLTRDDDDELDDDRDRDRGGRERER